MPHTKVRVNSGLFTFLTQPGMVDLIITTGFLAVANNLGDVFPFFRVDVRSVYARANFFVNSLLVGLSVVCQND